ncbi:MAG: type II secretion system F family protein [Aquihabitans sp.]
MVVLVAITAATAVVLASAGWASVPSVAHAPTSIRGRPNPGSVGWVVAVALPVAAAAAFGPTAALGLVVSVVVVRAATIRRVRQRADRLLDQSMPELIDLLMIAASAGQPVPACLASVAERAPAPLRPVLVRARHRVERGEAVAVALADVGPGLGALGPAVAEALVSAHRTGTPLQPALQRVAVVARDRRRRAAEEAARRLPVTLLFPLVCCVLPAFVLLAVVPLLATSLQSLQP